MIDTKQYVIKQIEERKHSLFAIVVHRYFRQSENVAITPSWISKSRLKKASALTARLSTGLRVCKIPICSCTLIRRLSVLPWRPSDDGVARMFCDLRTPDGAPAAGDSRHVLMNMLKRAGAMGYSVNIGTAVEYFCFKSDSAPEPIDKGRLFRFGAARQRVRPSPRNGAHAREDGHSR